MLENDITRLGLSEKEAKVYLASLELGPATVQIISQKAGVNRATTYVVIDSLTEMGLMSTYDKGKKTFFTAESPERLLEYLKDQERTVKDKIDILREKMPELKSLVNIDTDKPIVRYYEGVEGLRAVQDDFADSLDEGDILYTFLPYDHFNATSLPAKMPLSAAKRVQKKIKMHVIYNSKIRQRAYEKEAEAHMRKYMYLPFDQFPFEGGMNIYGDKIFMIDYKGKTGGLVIENKTLANMMVNLFKLAWQQKKTSAGNSDIKDK